MVEIELPTDNSGQVSVTVEERAEGSERDSYEELKMKVSGSFASQRYAEIAYNSLGVEIESARFEVSLVLPVQGFNIVASFTAFEVINIRVSFYSFFEHLVLTIYTIPLTCEPNQLTSNSTLTWK